MDEKTLHTLEYFKILEKLADYAAFAPSAERARALRPTTDIEEARRWQRETAEALQLLVTRPDLTIGGARDIRAAVDLAAHGGTLLPADLNDIKFTLIAARELARIFDRLEAQFPNLCAIAAGLRQPLGLVDAISRALSERGEILDSASPKLGVIRHDLRIAYDRLMAKLQRMVVDPKNTPYLQDALVTQRDGRYVIPLRAEFKGRIRSVVHDQSASGATLFVEPLAVVELNNQYRELQLAEREEERRILSDLSRQVGMQAGDIAQTLESVAELDFIFCKAKYADDLHAGEPVLSPIKRPTMDDHRPPANSGGQLSAVGGQHPGSVIRMRDARHPLLDPNTVVPIDVELDEQTYALVVTGPNTGGKTVALKTVGLLALMAQSGLHLPTHSGAEISLFHDIYADIGDEQSIEQSLSTFSGHITNIIRILDKADQRSLVILDELGAGTDPQEGAALARALLGHLLERGITTLVTTHHPELKAFAHSTPGVVNASVEFDLVTLRPTFHLTIGLPGRSNALAIAQRLGMPEAIIAEARKEITPQEQSVDSMLDEIHRQRDHARKARGAADRARHETTTLQAELQRRLEKIEDERRAILEKARGEALAEMGSLQSELRETRRQLARARQPLEALQAVEEKVEEMQENAEQPVERRPMTDDRRPSAVSGQRSAVSGQPPAIALGSKVRLRSLGTTGVVTALGESEAEVQVGMLRIRTRLTDIEAVGGSEQLSVSSDQYPVTSKTLNVERLTLNDSESPGLELDLRGQRAEDALDELERYLDSAYLAGLPWVRIIHGKGTGKLRQAVREALHHHPNVSTFEAGGDKEGGEGVTVAKLKGN